MITARGLSYGGLQHSSLWFDTLYWSGVADATTTTTTPPNGWESARLYDRFLQRLGRGNGGVVQADELWTAARVWEVLADAQEAVYSDLAPVVPNAFVSAPTLLTSSDGGVTYDFPDYPFGHVEVYAEEAGGRQLFASTYANPCGDFLFEQAALRSPGNRPRVYSAGPWARFSGFPERMDDATEPSLQPPQARELILYRALVNACDVWGAQLDSAPFEKRYGEARKRWLTVWKTQDATSGKANGLTRVPWWLTLPSYR